MLKVFNKRGYFVPLVVNSRSVKIAFDYAVLYPNADNSDKEIGVWYEHVFKYKPSEQQIKDFILSEINKATDERILSGFTWKDMQVWLSSENQFNYKAAYDLAVQTNGANLPTVFKFGTTENPQYYKFDTIEELTDFYTKAMKFINEQLAIGWAKKDSINWDDYKLPNV